MYIKYLKILLPFQESYNSERFLGFQVLDSQTEYLFSFLLYNDILSS